MTGKSHENDPLAGVELSRRELIQRIVVGSAFALPVVASFDMALLGPGSAYANEYANQTENAEFTSAAAATFTVGQAQTFNIVTPGGAPMRVSLQSGTLPKGVVFTAIDTDGEQSTTDGTLSGTAAVGTGGVYALTLLASDGTYNTENATQAFTLTVDEAPSFSSATVATLNVNGGATVNVRTGGYPLPSIALSGTLPTGMTFTDNATTGTATISGSPQAPGTYVLELTATNSAGKATQALTLTVQEAPSFTSVGEATFSTTTSSSFQITTASAPEATITLVGALPSGLEFTADAAAGSAMISGRPSTAGAGVHQLTLSASNGISPDGTQAFVLTITPADAFTTSNVKTTGTTQVNFNATVPGPGTITADVTAAASAASAAKKATPKRLTLASSKTKVKKAGKLKLKTKPTGAGRKFVKSGNPKTELWLTVTYTPKNGKPASHTIKRLHLK